LASSELGVESNSLYIAFLPASPTAEAQQNLMIFRGEVDDFAVDWHEVYHLCRKRMSESSLYGALLERTMCMPATIRNATTVEEIVAKYPASEYQLGVRSGACTRRILASFKTPQIVAHLDVSSIYPVAVLLVELLGGCSLTGPEVNGLNSSVAQTLFEMPQEPTAHTGPLGIQPHAKDAQVEDIPDIGWLPVPQGERHDPVSDRHQAYTPWYP